MVLRHLVVAAALCISGFAHASLVDTDYLDSLSDNYGLNPTAAGIGGAAVNGAATSNFKFSVDALSDLTGSWSLYTTKGVMTEIALFGPGSFSSVLTGNSANTGSFSFSNLVAGAYTISFTFSSAGKGLAGFYGTMSTVAAVPEPETYALVLAGLGVVGFAARRRKAQN